MEAQLLHSVNDVSRLLLHTPGKPGDMNSLLLHIAEKAREAFSADACIILAFNPITGRFIESQAAGNLQAKNEMLHDRPRAEGVTQQVLKDGLLITEDLEANSKYHNQFTRREGFRAFAGVALRTRHRQRPLGVLYLNFRNPREFSIADCESFKIFAVQAAFLLQEAWLAHNYEEVARIGQQVNQSLATVKDLFQVLQTYVDSVLDERHTLMLAVFNLQTITLDIYLSKHNHTIHMDRPLDAGGTCKYVLETQETIFITQLSQEKKQLPFEVINISENEEEESFIFVPLVFRELPLGVLSIQNSQPGAYGQEDLFVLQLLASYISLALHNMRLYDSLNQLNAAGQLLTQQLEAEQTLQATVDKIREATQADVAILYPYEANRQRFVSPPRIAGTLNASFPQSMYPKRPNDIARIALHLEEPFFAKESTAIYSSMHRNVRTREENFQSREKIRSTAILPLRVGDEAVGVLFVNFRQPQRFDATQKKLIDGLAQYAAIAIKNAQEYGSLIQRRVRELEILQHIDRELTRNLDLHSVLNTLLRLAKEHVPAEACSIMLPNPRTQILEIPAALGRDAEARRATIISLQETKGITRWVLEQKLPALVDNVHNHPWRDIYIPVTADIVSELDVPLLDGQEIVGILNFESTKEGAFRQEDQDFLLTLAGQGVLAIKNAQAYEREKLLAAQAQALNQISKEIIGQLDSTYILDLILEKALALTHMTTGGLLLYDSERNDLWLVSQRGAKAQKGLRMMVDQGIVGYVATHRRSVNADLSQPPWDKIYVELTPGTHSELAVPLLVGNELRGVLNVESSTPNRFSEGDERLLQGLADLAVIALQNAESFEREKRLAEEGKVLNEISKEIIGQLDHVHIFDLILEKALDLTHSNMGNLMLYDPEQNDLWMAAQHGVTKDKQGQRQGLNQGIVGYVARHKKFLNVDVTQSPWNEIYLDFFPGAHFELAVPLLAGNELRGVLNIESPFLNNFKESDVRLLQGLADLAVIALQNAQAREREKHLVAETRIFDQISREITSQLDPDYIFKFILEKALELTRSTTGTLEFYDPRWKDLRLVAEQGVVEERKGQHLSLDQGVVGYVAKHKQMRNVDPSQSPWKEVYIPSIHGTRSELAVPMLAGNELRGVLNVESPFPNNFKESDERSLQALAQLAVVALQNAERYVKAEAAAKLSNLLYRAGQELGKVTEFSELNQAYDVLLNIVQEYCNGYVVISQYKDETRELEVIRTGQRQESPPFPPKNLTEKILRERGEILIYDISDPPEELVLAKSLDQTLRSLVATTIVFKERYYGNLEITHEEVGHFGDDDVRFLQGLTQQLASTIYRLEVAQARQEFEQRAVSAEEMSSIGQSAFEVTHRLGNYLGLVETYINSIRSELEQQGGMSAVINRKLEQIHESVQAVLSFSRNLKNELANLGRKEETAGGPVVVSPRMLLTSAANVPSLPPNIQILLDIEEEVVSVSAIPGLVADILHNLIDNAIQAMPKGGTITLRTRNTGRNVALDVIDTGVGIAPEKLSNIFSLFFSTKRSSGFGLWSARRNALKNRGDLKVESKVGHGTTFTLLLPRVDERLT